jgi:DNA (cytosine-5)-methyltransferase 1
MILLDLFSGYGGFRKGLEQAGFKFSKVYYSEIDKHAIANYKYNYETAEHIGAVKDIFYKGIERPDIITFGSPCTDFSVIGKRSGLFGNQSSLIRYAFAAISHFQPSIFIWENVKGVFSSNDGADFWAIIQAFANIGNYQIEWQLCNTLWFLPQNRERIFLVGRIANRCAGQVFPIGENDELFATKNVANKGRTQTEFCTTIKHGFGGKVDDTFIVTRPHGFNKGTETNICPTIKSSAFQDNNFIVSYTRDEKGNIKNYHKKDTANTVKGSSGNTSQYVSFSNKIRKLTEIECERLQGLPDDWTKYGNYNGTIKEIPMTQRYKLLGNGVTVKVIEEIGKSILKNTKQ